jgi:hypothetical protein
MASKRRPDNRGSAGRANSIAAKGLRVHMESRGLDWELFDKLMRQGLNTENIRRALGIKTYHTADKYVKAYRKEHLKQEYDHESKA